MSIIGYDGYDHYAAITDMQTRQGALIWSDVFNYVENPAISFSTGRGGFGRAVLLPSSAKASSIDANRGGAWIGAAVNQNLATGFVGCAVQAVGIANLYLDDFRIELMDYIGNDVQMFVVFGTNSGAVSVYRYVSPTVDPVLLGNSAPGQFSPFVYNYFEVGATISNSVGAVEVRINSNPVLILANKDNQNTSNAYFNGFRIRAGDLTPFDGISEVGSYVLAVDDTYACSTALGGGSYVTSTFLGDVRVADLYAISDQSVTWTPLSGANWQRISNSTFQGDASYNSTATINNSDLFNFGTLVGTISAVIAVQITGAYRKTEAAVHQIKQDISSSGTPASGATWAMSTSYTYVSDVFEVDPNTSASWTISAVNSLKVGYTLVS